MLVVYRLILLGSSSDLVIKLAVSYAHLSLYDYKAWMKRMYSSLELIWCWFVSPVVPIFANLSISQCFCNLNFNRLKLYCLVKRRCLLYITYLSLPDLVNSEVSVIVVAHTSVSNCPQKKYMDRLQISQALLLSITVHQIIDTSHQCLNLNDQLITVLF